MKIGPMDYGSGRSKYMNLLENGILLGFLFAFCLTGTLLSVLLSALAWTKVQALEKSTHTFQYVPIDEEVAKANDKTVEQWATSPESIAQQEKLFKEDRDELMPEFAPDEEDKKLYTF